VNIPPTVSEKWAVAMVKLQRSWLSPTSEPNIKIAQRNETQPRETATASPDLLRVATEAQHV